MVNLIETEQKYGSKKSLKFSYLYIKIIYKKKIKIQFQ